MPRQGRRLLTALLELPRPPRVVRQAIGGRRQGRLHEGARRELPHGVVRAAPGPDPHPRPQAGGVGVELILVRHALPERIIATDGPADPPLTELGHRQAKTTAEWLAPERFDALYTSPLQRARQTAEPIASCVGLEIQVEDGIAEYDRGS